MRFKARFPKAGELPYTPTPARSSGPLIALFLVILLFGLATIRPAKAASWVTNGPLTTPRQNHTATLLPDGTLLVAGGWNGSTALATAEIFDPTTGKWTFTGAMTTNRVLSHGNLAP